METVCIIPARFDSSRFPGKLLKKLGNKEIILHVIDKVQTSRVEKVIVATDDRRIEKVVESVGVQAVMTPKELASGTDRIAYAVDKIGIDADFILNVQGDEPFISPKLIDKLINEHVNNPEIDIFTAVKKADKDEINDPGAVKVVLRNDNCALYFSRATIPHNRDDSGRENNFLIHIGIYNYKYEALKKFISLEQSKLEKIEKLEQLRALENGMSIKVINYDYKGFGIDTEEDLKKAEKILQL